MNCPELSSNTSYLSHFNIVRLPSELPPSSPAFGVLSLGVVVLVPGRGYAIQLERGCILSARPLSSLVALTPAPTSTILLSEQDWEEQALADSMVLSDAEG